MHRKSEGPAGYAVLPKHFARRPGRKLILPYEHRADELVCRAALASPYIYYTLFVVAARTLLWAFAPWTLTGAHHALVWIGHGRVYTEHAGHGSGFRSHAVTVSQLVPGTPAARQGFRTPVPLALRLQRTWKESSWQSCGEEGNEDEKVRLPSPSADRMRALPRKKLAGGVIDACQYGRTCR